MDNKESFSEGLSKFVSHPIQYIRDQDYGGLLFNKNQSSNAGVDGTNESSSENVAKRISNIRSATKQRSKQQVLSDLMNSQHTMYSSALTNRNIAASKQEMKDAQLDAFAAIIKSRSIEDEDGEYDEYNTTKDIISHYIDLQNSEEINKKIVEYADSEDDPYNFAMDLGVLLSPKDKRIRNIQNGYEMLFGTTGPKWMAETEDFLVNRLVGGLSSWVDKIKKGDYNGLAELSDSDEAPIIGAMENYAYNNFGQHLDNLDQYQQAKMLDDLQDLDLLQKYLPNKSTDFANKFEGAVQAGLTTAFPLATLGFEALSEIPVVGDLTSGVLQTIARGIGQVIGDTVGLPITLNLNNQEERYAWYEALGGLFMWRDHEVGNPKGGKATRAGWDNSVKQFQKWLVEDGKETLNELVDNFKKRRESKQRQKEFEKSVEEQKKQVDSQIVMEDLAGTLLNNGKNNFKRTMKPDLANGIANLPQRVLDNTKTFDGITREAGDAQGGIVDFQNSILSLFKSDEFKTSRESDNYTTPNGAVVHPVADAIGMLRSIYESIKDRDNLELLDKIEKKLDDGKITVLDKKNLARQISREADSFTDSFEQRTGKSAKEAELIREYLQQDIRNADPFLNEFMTTTDSIYSNLSKVKKFANEKAEKVSTARDQQKLPKIGRSIIKGVSPVVDTILTSGKSIYDQAKKNAREPYKPVTLEKDIPTILKAFSEQKSKSVPGKGFNVSAFMEMVDRWNYNENEYAYKNEVNNFLEDIIESSDVNPTNKRRLNANEIPALAEILREAGATPEEIAGLEESLGVVIQEPLFEVTDGGTKTDLQGNPIQGKKSKSETNKNSK